MEKDANGNTLPRNLVLRQMRTTSCVPMYLCIAHGVSVAFLAPVKLKEKMIRLITLDINDYK